MKKFRFDVNLSVEVESFDQFDAAEMIRDAFGLGEVCGLDIVQSEVGEFTVAD